MENPTIESVAKGFPRDELFAELGKLPYNAFELAEFKKQARAVALSLELQRRMDLARSKGLTAAELARFSRAGCS